MDGEPKNCPEGLLFLIKTRLQDKEEEDWFRFEDVRYWHIIHLYLCQNEKLKTFAVDRSHHIILNGFYADIDVKPPKEGDDM